MRVATTATAIDTTGRVVEDAAHRHRRGGRRGGEAQKVVHAAAAAATTATARPQVHSAEEDTRDDAGGTRDRVVTDKYWHPPVCRRVRGRWMTGWVSSQVGSSTRAPAGGAPSPASPGLMGGWGARPTRSRPPPNGTFGVGAWGWGERGGQQRGRG